MTARELAWKALGILKSNEWGRRAFVRRESTERGTSFSYCLLGAVMEADGFKFFAVHGLNASDRYEPTDAAVDLMDALARVTKHPFPHAWNDRPGRTKAEVVAALELAWAVLE